jgi:hypothetical protein
MHNTTRKQAFSRTPKQHFLKTLTDRGKTFANFCKQYILTPFLVENSDEHW